MSEGNERATRIMAPLSFVGLPTSVFNRIYEAVTLLPDGYAKGLVEAIATLLEERE